MRAIACLFMCTLALEVYGVQAVRTVPSRVVLPSSPNQYPVFRDTARLLRNADEINDVANSVSATNALQQEEDELVSRLSWTGATGSLYEAMAEIQHPTQVTSIYHIRNIGEGDTPRKVLSLKLKEIAKRGSIKPGPRDGFKHSEDHSFFIWVYLDDAPGSHLKYGYIRNEAYKRTKELAFSDSLNSQLIEDLSSANEIRKMVSIRSKLLERIKTREAQAELDRQTQTLIQNQRKLAKIHRDLQVELRNASRSSELLRNISLLQQVVGIAQFVYEVNSEFGSDPKMQLIWDRHDPKTATGLKSSLSEYTVETENTIGRLRRQTKEIKKNNAVLYREVIEISISHGAPKQLKH